MARNDITTERFGRRSSGIRPDPQIAPRETRITEGIRHGGRFTLGDPRD
jgi:hypothetical protein